MSTFFLKFNYLKKMMFFKNSNNLKKKYKYHYYNFISYTLEIKNNNIILSLRNFQIFFTFFSLFTQSKYKFLILDHTQYYFNLFNALTFQIPILLHYNNFFKFPLSKSKDYKIAFYFYLFFKKLNINMLIILDFDFYCSFLPYFNLFNLFLFSFVNNSKFITYLDFFFIYKKNFFLLEKILFLSKILEISNSVKI